MNDQTPRDAVRGDPSTNVYVAIWMGMIAIVALEVALTYAHLPSTVLLAALLVLALVEAAIGIMYFMHVKYESAILRWWAVPTLVFVLLMMNQIWPDAYRVFALRL
jgi:caa(3)-type oxidase subunit IV